MYYDPVKEMLGSVFIRTPFLRRLFYRLLDAVLVRSWHMHREIKIWAAEHKNATHILDAGSGYGQYTYYLNRLNPRYSIFGLDIKQDQVSRCNTFYRERSIANVYFRTGDLKDFCQPKAFDLILCVDVLGYLEDDTGVFENMYESLRDNGIFLVSVPSDKRESSGIENFRFPEEAALVKPGYTMASIKSRLKRLGYKKVRARYIYGRPGQLSWLLSIKWPLTLVRKAKALVIFFPLYFMIIFPLCLVLNFMDTRMGHLTGAGIILKAYK
jgi:SAM-dependent methyltransferase